MILAVILFFLVLDEGRVPLTHHLPVDLVGGFVLRSATEMVYMLVVADSTSRDAPPKNYRLLLSHNFYLCLASLSLNDCGNQFTHELAGV